MIRGIMYIAIVSLLISGCLTEPRKAPATPEPDVSEYAAPLIKVISYPANVTGEGNFTIAWEVSGGLLGEITHSSVHWGFKTGRADVRDYGRFSTVQSGKAPQEFSTEIKAPANGTIYFRAHAIVDGEDLYSDEYRITIVPR